MTLHYHKTEQGILQKCYHSSKSLLLSWQFWLGTTLSFPLEHVIWEKIPPFCYLAKYFGL